MKVSSDLLIYVKRPLDLHLYKYKETSIYIYIITTYRWNGKPREFVGHGADWPIRWSR